jgi:hypothetical protein
VLVIYRDGFVNHERVRPKSARDAAGFSTLLRSLKRNSGHTLPQLEERAVLQDTVLPRSTVANMLRRGSEEGEC